MGGRIGSTPSSKRNRRGLLSCLLLVLVLPWTAGAGTVHSGVVLQFPQRVEVNRDPITLGDIAEIRTDDAEKAAVLATVVIGKAPLAGHYRRMSLDYIQLRLKQSRMDVEDFHLNGPEAVEIWRGSVRISSPELEMMVRDHLAATPMGQGEDVIVSAVDVPEDGVTLPKGDLAYDIETVRQSRLSGVQSLFLHFRVDGEPVKRLMVTAQLDVFRSVLVARHPLSRGQVLTRSDLDMQRVNIAGLPDDLVFRFEDAVGRQVRRRIGPRDVLRSDWIELPTIVDRGDRVLLVAEHNGLRITALGEVKRKGKLGERIPVLNISSNKSVYGHLVDARTVRVTF